MNKGTANHLDHPQGYPLRTTASGNKTIMLLVGGSVVGDVYGLYWILLQTAKLLQKRISFFSGESDEFQAMPPQLQRQPWSQSATFHP